MPLNGRKVKQRSSSSTVRKKGFGPFKKEWWSLPASVKEPIMKELEEKFELLFNKLKVFNTVDIVRKTVKPVKVPVKIEL